MKILSSPAPENTRSFIKEHYLHREDTMLLLIGDCRVHYTGRAKSVLDFGERLIVFKEDRCVIIHQRTGRDPTNWLPPKTRCSFTAEDGCLIVNIRRHKPLETMQIKFRDVKAVIATTLKDDEKIRLVGIERDLHKIIKQNPELIEEELRIVKEEKTTRSGVIDLYAKDKDGVPVIIEIKKGPTGISGANQLIAYITDFKNKNPQAKIRGILIAPQIQTTAKTILEKHDIEYKEIKLDVDFTEDKQKTLLTLYTEKEE